MEYLPLVAAVIDYIYYAWRIDYRNLEIVYFRRVSPEFEPESYDLKFPKGRYFEDIWVDNILYVMTILLFKKKMSYPRVFMDPKWCADFFEGDEMGRYDSCLRFCYINYTYPGSLKALLPSEEELSDLIIK